MLVGKNRFMVEKIKGLVIRTQNINENDKYLTVLCEKYGKIGFKAAGVRSLKSKNLASAQLFTYSEFTITRTGQFTRMSEAQVVENFYDLRLDIASLALATYFAEIAGIICVDESDEDGILRLLLNSLYLLSVKKFPRRVIKAVFELRVLAKSGFMPSLTVCEVCSRGTFDDANAEVIFFDVLGGSLVCADCMGKLKEYAQLRRVPRDVLNMMRFVVAASDEKLFSFALDETIEDELANICEKYLLAQIGMNMYSDALKHYKNYEKSMKQ